MNSIGSSRASRDTDKTLFSYLLALLVSAALIFFVVPAATAHASRVTTEAELLRAINAGASDPIPCRNLGITIADDSAFWSWMWNLETGSEHRSPCLSRATTLSKLEKSGLLVSLNCVYDCEPSMVSTRSAAYWDRVSSIAAGSSGSRYDRAMQVYAALLASCDYDTDSLNDSERYARHCTAASALLDGQAICAGYASACVDLFRAVGIDAWLVCSPEHAWVDCELDGLRLTCDPTQDDVDGSYDCFMLLPDGTPYRPPSSQGSLASEASPVASGVQPFEPAVDEPVASSVPDATPLASRSQRFASVPVYALARRASLSIGLVSASETIYAPIVRRDESDLISRVVFVLTGYEPIPSDASIRA